MPDISGCWKARSWFKGAPGDFNEIQILKSVHAPGEFRLIPQQSADQPLFSIPIKWVAGTRKFEATYTSPQTSQKISMQLARGSQTMRVMIEVDEATKEAFVGRGMSESEIDELLNQEWTLKPEPLPQFVDTEKPGKVAANASQDAPDVTTEAATGKTRADAGVPDITGEWSLGPKGEFGKAVIRSKGDSTTFVIDQLNKKGQIARHGRPQELKWVPSTGKGTGQFEGEVLGPDGQPCGRVVVKLQADHSTLSYRVQLDEQARQKILADSGLANEDLDAITDLVWKRLSSPGNDTADQSRKPRPDAEEPQSPIEKVLEPTERIELVQGHAKLVVCRSGIERTAIADQSVIDVVQFSPREFNVIGRAPGSTTLTVWFEKKFEQKTEPLIYLVDVVRERSATGVEIAAAKPLAQQLAAREAAAAAEAATIRQLQASGAADKNQAAIALHQRQLTSLLNAAFDLKLQLEELQVQELQSRLSRIDRQIGQRRHLREKIIARRAAQLFEGEALTWTPVEPRASRQENKQADVQTVTQKPSDQANPPAATGNLANGNPAALIPPQADSKQASITPRMSIETMRDHLRPVTDRIAVAEGRVRELERFYFRDRSNAAELQRAWDELSSARDEVRSRLAPLRQAISEFDTEIGESESLLGALTLQRDSKMELLAKGQATEAEVRAASAARKRAFDAVASIDAMRQDCKSTLSELSPGGFEDFPATYYVVSQADPQPGYDSITALKWLEATLGL
ncbi:MAG TPA: pilus assembly protein N-terminal domain-containing protein, partial [Planctomycetaceae bacterium]